MTHLIKYKIIVFVAIWLFCNAASIFACGCLGITTEKAIKKSSAVFSGKVVGFEYRKGIPNEFMDEQSKETRKKLVDYETLVVKIQVEQWWKGDVPMEIFLLTAETREADGTMTISSCDYFFSKDESYLIFAGGKGNEYRTRACSRTQKLTQAEKDLKILGEGKKPIENRAEPSLPL